MAYLKGSRVTGLSPKPIDVKGFTQSASEDLEGKYSRHEVLLADAFNVTDNVTISDNLILTKLSDDGEAITLTGNATTTRTITGSGSLEGSTFAQTPNASLTGMTGTIGSAVALGSATFPAGMSLQTVTDIIPGTNAAGTSLYGKTSGDPITKSEGSSGGSSSFDQFGLRGSITPYKAGSSFLVHMKFSAYVSTGTAYHTIFYKLDSGSYINTVPELSAAGTAVPGHSSTPVSLTGFASANSWDGVSLHIMHKPTYNLGQVIEYRLYISKSGSADTYIIENPRDLATIMITEIAG
jgi:hypothetical protein